MESIKNRILILIRFLQAGPRTREVTSPLEFSYLHTMDKKLPEVDLVALAMDGRHFAEKKGGVLRIIDSVTGKVVAVQEGTNPITNREDFSEVVLPNGTTVLVQKGLEKYATNPELHRELQPFLIDIICQKLVEGGSLMLICQEPGMPSFNTVCRWRRAHEWVRTALRQAREDRAEYLRDKAMQVAENSQNPFDTIDADKLKVDSYKWAAGVDNSQFSPKAKVEATVNMPTQIIVMTGINREAVDNTIEASKTLDVGETSGKKS